MYCYILSGDRVSALCADACSARVKYAVVSPKVAALQTTAPTQTM